MGPTDAFILSWLAQQQTWPDRKGFPGGVYICLQIKSSPWPSEYLVMRVHGAISEFSCYVIIVCKTWGESPWSERAWPCHLGSFALYLQMCMLSCFSHVWLCVTLWTIARQPSLSMGFSRQKYWSGLPFPPPGDLPDPGIKSTSYASCIGRQVLNH